MEGQTPVDDEPGKERQRNQGRTHPSARVRQPTEREGRRQHGAFNVAQFNVALMWHLKYIHGDPASWSTT